MSVNYMTPNELITIPAGVGGGKFRTSNKAISPGTGSFGN